MPVDGRTRHYGTFYGLDDLPDAASGAPLILVHGNCQAEALRVLLSAAPDLDAVTVRMPPVFELTAEDVPHLQRLLGRCQVLLSQPVSENYRELPLGTDQVAALLPRDATVIRWPVLRFAGFHPWQAIVRDPLDPARNPPVVPYHDLRTLAEAHHGARTLPVTPPAGALARIADDSRAELARREDADCDVAISDLFEQPEIGDMLTINHPGNRVLIALARRIQLALGRPPSATDPGRVLLGDVVAPVAAAALRALDLTGDGIADWRVGGEPVSALTVHDAQLQWYGENPQVVETGFARHHDTLASLGLA